MLSGVDPNADNFVSAGIVTTTAALIGCLARLEPNFESKASYMDVNCFVAYKHCEFCCPVIIDMLLISTCNVVEHLDRFLQWGRFKMTACT